MPPSVEAKQRRGRRAGGRRAQLGSRDDQAPPPLPTKRPVAPLEVLSQDEIELIHDYALRVLESIGLEFMLPEAWDILEANGVSVDRGSGMARFPREIVEHWVAQAPSVITLRSKDGKRDVTFGGDQIAYGSVASAPNVLDLERGRRSGDQSSFRDLVKISHALHSCSFMSGYPVEPTDLPVNTRHLDCYLDLLTLTDKPFRIYAIGETRVKDALAIVELAHGIDRAQLARAPRLMTNLNVNSPLKVDGPLLQGAMEMVRNGQIVVVTPVAFAGAMSPITLSGSLIQFNAECLATIAFLQMVNPGAPLLYGSVFSNIDMKSGAPTFGTPEHVTGLVATGQLARRYDIPMRGFLSASSKAVDAQAAYETLNCLWANVLAGVHCVFHAHGFLDAALIASYEKAVLDSEIIGMMQAIPPRIDFSDADEALEAIKGVGPGGHYLGAPHTMSRYQSAFYRPFLADWQPYEFWADKGGVETAERARQRWHELLEGYRPPDIGPGLKEALCDFVERRKREIGTEEIA